MEQISRDEFLEEIVCLENRVDRKVEQVKEVAFKLEERQREVERKVETHLVIEESKQIEEKLEEVADKVNNPERGLVAVQVDLCKTLKRFEESMKQSDEDFDERIKGLETAENDTRKSLETMIRAMEKKMYIGFGILGFVYIADKPEMAVKYISLLASTFYNILLTLVP